MATTPSSRRWPFAIVLVVILAVAIAAIVLATRPPGPPSPSAPAGASAVALASASSCPTPPASGGALASGQAACAAPVGGGAGGAVGGGAAGGGGNGGGAGGGNAGGGASPGATEAASPTESPTPLADVGGPYLVKQIETLGGESISGVVCSTSSPFSVAAHTSKAAWTFVFVPRDASHGSVSYRYSIASAGESHDARGTYAIAGAAPAGALQVSLVVSDHVVFHGFDGNIPNQYKFDLVSQPGAPGCSGS